MKTTAVRMHGKNDLRTDTFTLSPTQDDEVLVKVVCDSICMSTWKAAQLGNQHKRVPKDIAENPIIVGHEFAGEIVEVGAKWADDFSPGEKFAIQPAINYQGKGYGPGYSFTDFGGSATYTKIPSVVMEQGCLLKYNGDSFFDASLGEPMSCIIGALNASYHTQQWIYTHDMGIVSGGRMAITAGVGPMGLGAIDLALHGDVRPSLLVVTDIDQDRLDRAAEIFSPEDAKKDDIRLIYINTGQIENPVEQLMSFSDGQGYDDVLCMVPVREVVELSDSILGEDGCLNFFAGPTDKNFKAEINFYNVHYAATHLAGTSGGSVDDMKDALRYSEEGRTRPAAMVTHIGGLDSVAETTINLPDIPGGKKLIYTHIEMPLMAIEDFAQQDDPRFQQLAKLCDQNNGLWNAEAEAYVLQNW